MKFDTIIIGGGLAGLTCGIRLSEAGQRCAVISRGQSALHFSSGSLDLLAELPDGQPVQYPEEALSALAEQSPLHPYSLMGKQTVLQLAAESEQLLQRASLSFQGSCQKNHQRITPFGQPKTSWISPPEVPVSPLPWKKVTVINIAGFLDFQAEWVAESLKALGCVASVYELTLPILDKLRANPSEFRAVNIARLLDRSENLQPLIGELKVLMNGGEALILPACIGLENDTISQLQQALGIPVKLLPTLPPSVLGMRLHNTLYQRFRSLGGIIIPGDSVVDTEQQAGRINALYTKNHREVPLRANNIILASGSFFSSGLDADRNHVFETIFGLDVNAPADRSAWSKADFFEPQPWLQYGVTVDAQLHPFYQGNKIENLYAIGAVLANFDPIAQGCGGGVSLLTALYAAQQILTSVEKKHEPA